MSVEPVPGEASEASDTGDTGDAVQEAVDSDRANGGPDPVHGAEVLEASAMVATEQLPIANLIDSMITVALFVAVNRIAGLPWAIGAATLWSVKAVYSRWRQGLPIGKFLPLVTAGIIARGVIGIVTESEDVYFGLGIAGKAGIGLFLIGSALVGRNLIARLAPLLFGFDDATVAHPAYQRAMDKVAWLAGIAELLSAAFDVWLYQHSSVNGYVLIRFFVNWPFTTIVLLLAMAFLSRALAAIPGFPGMTAVMEAHMARYEQAWRDRPRR